MPALGALHLSQPPPTLLSTPRETETNAVASMSSAAINSIRRRQMNSPTTPSQWRQSTLCLSPAPSHYQTPPRSSPSSTSHYDGLVGIVSNLLRGTRHDIALPLDPPDPPEGGSASILAGDDLKPPKRIVRKGGEFSSVWFSRGGARQKLPGFGAGLTAFQEALLLKARTWEFVSRMMLVGMIPVPSTNESELDELEQAASVTGSVGVTRERHSPHQPARRHTTRHQRQQPTTWHRLCASASQLPLRCLSYHGRHLGYRQQLARRHCTR
ncbi:hypothetical protein GALMADRAFT_145808 [Galerina marginata CBS 339.88]|uniref:Uncharacterized protein n=1 Tax=Galerina marginata (strain CBS 339.88) TaxID=685588 RepID=A0A067SDV8_GALM3|nr:hypothetical protein GALMADRAFT_145808 [Galerina marginata CBS 339.88]